MKIIKKYHFFIYLSVLLVFFYLFSHKSNCLNKTNQSIDKTNKASTSNHEEDFKYNLAIPNNDITTIKTELHNDINTYENNNYIINTEDIINTLLEPSNGINKKMMVIKNWIKLDTKNELISLLELLTQNSDLNKTILKDRLFQILAGTDNQEIINILISIIKNEIPNFDFRVFPEDLQYEIRKVIRQSPQSDQTGKILADSINEPQLNDENINDILQINHPMLLFYQAQEADQRGDYDKIKNISLVRRICG